MDAPFLFCLIRKHATGRRALSRRPPCRTRSGIARLPGRALVLAAPRPYPDRPAQEVARAVGAAVRPQPRPAPARRHPTRSLGRRRDCCSPSRWERHSSAASCSASSPFSFGASHRSSTSTTPSPTGAYRHRSSGSTSALHVVTDLGNIRLVVVFALVLVAVELVRRRSRWSLPLPASPCSAARRWRCSRSRIWSAASGRR